MGINISGLGIANAIGFKPRVDGGRRFLPPNIQSSLVSVISTYGKKNTDSDRNILKDKTGKGNDFKLFNFSFSEASGYGEYKTDFNKNWTLEMAAITGNQIVTFNRGDYKAGVFFLKIPTSLKVNIASFTVDVDFKSSKEDAAPYYYYWDVTGKSNSDTATRNTIKNLGTAKPVASTSDEDAYSLENKNVAYEGMSGYNGYPVVFGANKTWETYATYNFTSTINDNKLHITKVLNSNGLIFSYVKRNDELLNIKEIPSFKIKVTGLEGESKLLYFYLSEENTANITILTLENGVHKIPKSLIPTNALPNSTWIGFKITSIQEGVSSFDCDITLEILPDYYGLCLDGITNYIECANIPAFTDYTYILMRQILSNNIPNSVTMYKGIVKAYAGAFTADYVINNEAAYINKFAFHSFGATNIIYRDKVANKIIWANTTSVNGIAVSRGSNTDDESITIAKFENNYRKMVFYKLMLWSKSINNTYYINMLRNLINNGGIIDLNDSIFDQTSNE